RLPASTPERTKLPRRGLMPHPREAHHFQRLDDISWYEHNSAQTLLSLGALRGICRWRRLDTAGSWEDVRWKLALSSFTTIKKASASSSLITAARTFSSTQLPSSAPECAVWSRDRKSVLTPSPIAAPVRSPSLTSRLRKVRPRGEVQVTKIGRFLR